MLRILAILLLTVPVAAGAEPIPPGAVRNLPHLLAAYRAQWPDAPAKYVSAGQVDQESGWDEKAHLHTSREDGYGLGQMTITKSCNIFKGAVKYKALKGWDWSKDPYNPLYQLTFLVLQDKDNYIQSKAVNAEERWKIALVRYNAGDGRINIRRRYAIAKGLPTDRWTGGLELAHGPAEYSILYGRPLWKAVNEYPDIICRKAEKYKGAIRWP
jgi:hypothetical protein